MSIFWEIISSVIEREKVHINMCLILNGYEHRAERIYKYKSIVNGEKEEKLLAVNFILVAFDI
jgi:hypothetical protein